MRYFPALRAGVAVFAGIAQLVERSYGENNHFVIARRQMEQELKQQPTPSPTPTQ